MRQLWATKPSFIQMADEFERRFGKFQQEDSERNLLLIGAVNARLEALKDLRNDDHVLLLKIYDRLNGNGGGGKII